MMLLRTTRPNPDVHAAFHARTHARTLSSTTHTHAHEHTHTLFIIYTYVHVLVLRFNHMQAPNFWKKQEACTSLWIGIDHC